MVIALFISSIRPSLVMPGRHSERGFSITVVSIISTGAGSVAVSARPSLPKTRSTSGNASACGPSAGRSSRPRATAAPAASSACRGWSPRPSRACSPSGTGHHHRSHHQQHGAADESVRGGGSSTPASSGSRARTGFRGWGRRDIAPEDPHDHDRQQEQRQQRRERHRERLAEGQRVEQPPFRSPRKKIGRNDVTMISIENSSGLVIVAVAWMMVAIFSAASGRVAGPARWCSSRR